MSSRDAYHTALAAGRVEHCPPVTRWEHPESGSVALAHDVFHPLPAAFDPCDVFYGDPPWRSGYAEFDRRAGVAGPDRPPYAALTGRLDSLALALGRPAVYVAGGDFGSGLRWSHAARTRLNGAAAWAYCYNGLAVPDTDSSEALLEWLAQRYDRVGDFVCGYGRAGRVFASRGLAFTLSDYNPACVGYVARHGAKWFPAVTEGGGGAHAG